MGNSQLTVQCGKFVGPKRPGESQVLRNALQGDTDDLIHDHKGLNTLNQLFINNAKENPSKPFLGTRSRIKVHDKQPDLKEAEKSTDQLVVVKPEEQYVPGPYLWKSYGEVFNESEAVARYLIHHSLCPYICTEEGLELRTIALYAKNREEWVVSDFGCMLTNITVVTLYDTLGKESIEYILD